MVSYTILEHDLGFPTSISGQTIEYRATRNMTKNQSAPLSLPALAVITGSFLSGNLSLEAPLAIFPPLIHPDRRHVIDLPDNRPFRT